MSHRGHALLLGLVVFVLVGWAVGALWTSIVGSGELEVVRDIAARALGGLTDVAKVVTWAGSAFLLVPLALICCVVLFRAGLRREAARRRCSASAARCCISDLGQAAGVPPAPSRRAPAGGDRLELSLGACDAGERLLVLAGPGVLRADGRFAHRSSASPLRSRCVLVVAVALSRVYLGVHYPADVIAGVLLGTGWAVFVARCLRRAHGCSARCAHATAAVSAWTTG